MLVKAFCDIIILTNKQKWSETYLMRSSWREYIVTGNWKNTQYGFGCYATDTETNEKVVLTGEQPRLLAKGDLIQASVIKSDASWHGTPWYKAVVLLPPMRSEKDVINYFSSAAFAGIGPTAAEHIYDTLGIKAPYLLLKNINYINRTSLSIRKKTIIKDSLDATCELDKITMFYPIFIRRPNLLSALHDYLHGQKILARLQQDPYQFVDECAGFTFAIADEIAYANGMDGHGKYRCEKLMSHALKQILNKSGDTYVDLSDNLAFTNWMKIASELSKNISPEWYISCDELKNHVHEMDDTDTTRLVMHQGKPHMTLTKYAKAEASIAEWVKRQMQSDTVVKATPQEVYKLIDDYAKEAGTAIDDTQRLAVMSAIRSPLSIISGGPGRGKTQVAACIAWIFNKLSTPPSNVVLTSFTGKATQRLRESVQRTFDGPINAATMLRFVYRQRYYKSLSKCAVNCKSPASIFAGNLVIIDEASMIDTNVMWQFLSLVQGAQVLIMGDVNQLPSIGVGQVLRDLINSDVIPVTTLVTCYRASSGILIQNADAILEDRLKDVVYDSQKFAWKAEGGHELINNIADEYSKLLNQGFTARDIAILAGCNTLKDEFSVYYLNVAIQAKRTDLGAIVPKLIYQRNKCSVPIHVGDRCIMTRNVSDQYCEDALNTGNQDLYNGDTGFIRSADRDNVIFETDDGRRFELSYETAQDLELAYATTIHKSQGSEYAVVLLAISTSLTMYPTFGSKNLLYTAITRAKNEVHLYGHKQSWAVCLSTALPARHTHLQDFLQEIY